MVLIPLHISLNVAGVFFLIPFYLSFVFHSHQFQSLLRLVLHLFEPFLVTISKSYPFLVEDHLYVTGNTGFVVVETVDSFCTYDCVSAEVNVFGKAINLYVSVLSVLICFQQHIHPFMTTVHPWSDSGFQQDNWISIQKSIFRMWWNCMMLNLCCEELMQC